MILNQTTNPNKRHNKRQHLNPYSLPRHLSTGQTYPRRKSKKPSRHRTINSLFSNFPLIVADAEFPTVSVYISKENNFRETADRAGRAYCRVAAISRRTEERERTQRSIRATLPRLCNVSSFFFSLPFFFCNIVESPEVRGVSRSRDRHWRTRVYGDH